MCLLKKKKLLKKVYINCIHTKTLYEQSINSYKLSRKKIYKNKIKTTIKKSQCTHLRLIPVSASLLKVPVCQ